MRLECLLAQQPISVLAYVCTGGHRGQSRALGRTRTLIDDALLAKAAEQQRKLESEIARLASLRVWTLSALEGMSSTELLDQIRAFKLIDKASAPSLTPTPGFEFQR